MGTSDGYHEVVSDWHQYFFFVGSLGDFEFGLDLLAEVPVLLGAVVLSLLIESVDIFFVHRGITHFYSLS